MSRKNENVCGIEIGLFGLVCFIVHVFVLYFSSFSSLFFVICLCTLDCNANREYFGINFV